MALISEQVEALQKLLKRMDNGSIDNEEVATRCKVHSLIHKQQALALSTMALSLANGMTQKKLHSAGLIGKNEIIRTDSEELGRELIECPDQDDIITRSECLDFSGEEKNYESCNSCKNFKLTRNLLMPAV